jgi:CBS domain-containing protein
MANAPTGTAPAPMTLAADTARELMTPNPLSIEENTSVTQALAVLTDRGLSAAVVTDEAGRPRGVLTRDDLLVHERERLGAGADPNTPVPTCVADVMTPTLFSVTPDTPARAVVVQLIGLQVQQLFVVDGFGAPIGSVSTFDVLRRLV